MAKKAIEEIYNDRRKDWYERDDLDMGSVKAQHKNNIARLADIERWRNDTNRPLYVAVFHGSGRHTKKSCAQEMSNTELFLERSLELALQEWQGRHVETEKHKLREYILEPCNACYSTTSSLCHFPCSCFPADDVTTKVYPAVMKADVLLWSTPVNQSMVSSRIKIVLDRLISLDGGYYTQNLPIKNDAYKQAAIALSQNKEVTYDPRMFGKVSAYFVTSKDLNNPLEEQAPYPKEFSRLGYLDYVVGAISHQGAEYGWFHADPYYAVSSASHDRELSYDKDEYDKKEADHEEGKEVILAALKKGEEFIESPPKLTSKGRVNRT